MLVVNSVDVLGLLVVYIVHCFWFTCVDVA